MAGAERRAPRSGGAAAPGAPPIPLTRLIVRIAAPIAALIASLIAAIPALPVAPLPGEEAAPPLPEGADAVIALLRGAPDDPARLEAVAAWAEEHGGVSRLAAALAARGRANVDALDLSLAGSLYESAGRPEDAIAPHEEALVRSLGLARSRRALAGLYARGGWPERAAAIAGDLPLDLSTALRLAAAGALGGEEGARRRLEASGLPAAERARLAGEAGIPALAAEIAEESGDLSAAFAHRLAAGDTAGARALLARGADPDPAARLAFARLTGERTVLESGLAARSDAAAAELRAALGLSLGEASAPAAADGGTELSALPPDEGDGAESPAPSESDGASEDGAAAEGGSPVADPRHAAALALLAQGSGESADPAAVAALTRDGPPSFVVAAAWLAVGDEKRARRELVRARLAPRPEEERWREALARRRPEWFGGEINAGAAIARLETIPTPAAGTSGLSGELPAPSPERSSIDRAILAAPPGSPAEAALLFHRHRLETREGAPGAAPIAGTDLARAAAIAPAEPVEWPLAEGIRVAMPLTIAARTGLDPRAVLASPIPLPDPIDRAIGREGDLAIRLGSRRPSRSDWHLVSWSEVPAGERSAPPTPPQGAAPLSSPAAPITASIDLGATGRLSAGNGLELRTAEGALVAAWIAPLPLSLAGSPALAAHLPPPLADYLDELRAEEVPLAEFPGLAETWRGFVLREGLDPQLRPEVIREGDRHLVLRGGGLRAELAPGEAPPAGPEPPQRGGARRAERDWRAESPPPAERSPATAPPPKGALEIEGSSLAEAARQGRELVAPFPAAEPAGTWTSRERLLPESIRLVRAGDLSLLLEASGWVEGGDRAGPRWLAFLPPPLPGPEGWRFEREEPGPGGRRGPDLTGPTSDGGLIRAFRLAEDRLAIATDRVLLCDLDGVLPPPAGPAGGTFERIRDVTDGDAGVWVLPAPGDRLAGERETIPLGRQGAFDIEGTGAAVWALGYDPLRVRLWLVRAAPEGTTEVELPEEIPVEEDRARQRPVALGRWGDLLLIAAHGHVWMESPAGWIDLLPRAAVRRTLPGPAWQAPPRVSGDRLIVAWPWGEIEEARAP